MGNIFKPLYNEEILNFIEQQLTVWPLARDNYAALNKIKRRKEKLGEYEIGIQWNPARIVSTGAKISDGNPGERPCFLCEENRPKEQCAIRILPEWDLLVNPYPIFPVHFTIVSTKHQPQDRLPFDIVELAERLPGLVVFFNGARAGASAPDHKHLQAVLKDELPLINLVENLHDNRNCQIIPSTELGIKFPFLFFSGIVSPDSSGLDVLKQAFRIGGLAEDDSLSDPALVNSFFWIDNKGMLRFVIIPRRAHRPQCYFRKDDHQRIISPGCVDMAGIIIAPRENDFEALDSRQIMEIYSDVGII